MTTHISLTNRKGSPGSGSSMPRRHSTHPVGYLMHDEHTDCPYLLWVRPFTMSSPLRKALGYYGLCRLLPNHSRSSLLKRSLVTTPKSTCLAPIGSCLDTGRSPSRVSPGLGQPVAPSGIFTGRFVCCHSMAPLGRSPRIRENIGDVRDIRTFNHDVAGGHACRAKLA